MRLHVADRVHFLDVLGQRGLIVTRSFVVDSFLVHHDTLSNSDAHGKRLVVLLEAAVLPRIKHFLISVAL